jgi:hypothetical protein
MKKKFTKLLGIGLTVALLTSLLTVAGPAMALSQPQVAISPVSAEIQATSTYSITVTVGKLVAAGNEIVIAFPAGTNLGAEGAYAGGTVNIEALAGIGAGASNSAPTSALVSGIYPAAQKLTLKLANAIGAGALVGITIPGIVNPSTPGTYTLTVGTQITGLLIPIELPVTSADYVIKAPALIPLPGIVEAYNSAGILMNQTQSINTAIISAGVKGRVEVGPGTYDEDVDCSVAYQTIVATGDPGTVIITDANKNGTGGTVNIGAAGSLTLGGVTFDGFTLSKTFLAPPETDVVTFNGSASYATVTNCTIAAGITSAVTTAAGSSSNTISKCTIDAKSTTGSPVGVIANGTTTISDCTIDVGVSNTSQAVTSSAGVNAFVQTKVKGCTITGSSGLGVAITAGYATVEANTLSSLRTALTISGGTAIIKGNTIDSCGSTIYASYADAIEITGGTANLYNNTIQNSISPNYAIGVAAGTVTANFNNIIDNAKNITTAVAITASHNWWGSSAGPAFGSIGGTGSLTSTTKPYLGSSVSDAALDMDVNYLLKKTTLGVDAYGLTAAGAADNIPVIGISKYSANPEITAPRIVGTGSVLAYYDIYVADPGATGLPVQLQLKFYGAVSPYTKLMYAGGLGGQWATVSTSGVNVAGGYAYCTITTTSSPSLTDLGGTPFALLEDKTVAPPALVEPAVGEYDISIEPMFTWGTVLGAIRYEITLSEDPTFSIIEWSYNVDNPFYKTDEALRYNTTYYWRVRGVLAEPYQVGRAWVTPATPWATGIFTTESEVVVEPDAIVVEPPKPEVNVEIPPTKITVEPAAPAVPNYMLWVIIAVGAVLIIALIVLIVRTRRVV